MNEILICKGCTQVFEKGHPFKAFISYLYVLTFSCILSTETERIIISSFYFYTSPLNSSNKASVFLFVVYYVFTH